MMKFHIIQARFGDCFLLEYGDKVDPEYMLIDGGPARTYEEHLKPSLTELVKGNKIRDVIISHVDNDHIIGVLDLLTELQVQQDTNIDPWLTIGQLWFNSFSNTIGTNDIVKRIGKINTVASMNGVQMQAMSMAVNGIKEGSRVINRAGILKIPVNKDAVNGFYLATKDRQLIQRTGMEITVIGPTSANLTKLQAEWEEWVKKNEQKIAEGKYTRDVAAALDRSVPNLSSIVLLLNIDGKTILLTGDCRSDHLQQGLIETGVADSGKLHVDIFKVPHHGSMRNSSKQFFDNVTADTYIISADGTYDNPDDDVLFWIVESAHAARRKIRLVLTNETASTHALVAKYEPSQYGYEIVFMNAADHFLTL